MSEIDYSNANGSLGNITYQYDAAGRKTSIGGSLARTALPTAFSNATYNAANQLTQWNGVTLTYDANGNLTNDGGSAYSWNARNQLAGISGLANASFAYDQTGKRVGTQVNSAAAQNYFFDGANIVQQQSGGAVTANLFTGLGLDETYTRTDASGTFSFLTDGLNSTVGLTDSSGNNSTQYTYDPFGLTNQSGNANANTQQYSGREDDGTGLYYMRARYYSPKIGRFISQDPIGMRGGMNMYAYAFGNPLCFADPMGTDPKGGGPGLLPWLAFGLPILGMVLGGPVGAELGELVAMGLEAAEIAPAVEAVETLEAVATWEGEGGALGGFVDGGSALAGDVSSPSFFDGTYYTEKVLSQMASGDFHSFSESVAAFESEGTVSSVTGGDGVVRQMLEIPGSYLSPKGTWYDGVFQFMKEADGAINHRFFLQTP